MKDRNAETLPIFAVIGGEFGHPAFAFGRDRGVGPGVVLGGVEGEATLLASDFEIFPEGWSLIRAFRNRASIEAGP